MPDADVRFRHGFYQPPQSQALFDMLLAETAWRQETITLWEQQRLQPRLSAWYGDPGSRYTYSGTTFHPLPWTATLLRIKADIERTAGLQFNSVLLNLYRDEHDSVAWHSDHEREFGKDPVIASLSLGETRVFRFRHRSRKDLKRVDLELTDGSLLLMAGPTQRCWQHAIEKERRPCGPRINLTFRTILQLA
ncbi:alpha-ketoglutarate-dependent dioxygenase AlkB [Oxalobacteraceae bacterium OM1]|nr:alpha-ketoglutarate-dependent dioxygenase AlkB [Oxalobacteraceae bacterium OM1]